MSDTIGNAAGMLWQYLNENGAASASRIARETGLDNKQLQRAIGWLAKEDKLRFDTSGRHEIIGLK